MTKRPIDDTGASIDEPIDDIVIEYSETIDRAVDGTLSERERSEFKTRLVQSAALQEAYADALAVRGPLAARAAENCPDALVNDIWSRVAQLPENPATATSPATRWWARVMPFAGAAATVLLAVWGFSSVLSPGSPAPQPGTIEAIVAKSNGEYTKEELLTAVDDARVALAIFARTMNKTATLVSDDVKSSFTYPVTLGLKETWEHVPAPFGARESTPRRG